MPGVLKSLNKVPRRVVNHRGIPKESGTDGLCVVYLGTEHRWAGSHLQDILFSLGALGSPTQGASCAEGVSSREYLPPDDRGYLLGGHSVTLPVFKTKGKQLFRRAVTPVQRPRGTVQDV